MWGGPNQIFGNTFSPSRQNLLEKFLPMNIWASCFLKSLVERKFSILTPLNQVQTVLWVFQGVELHSEHFLNFIASKNIKLRTFGLNFTFFSSWRRHYHASLYNIKIITKNWLSFMDTYIIFIPSKTLLSKKTCLKTKLQGCWQKNIEILMSFL